MGAPSLGPEGLTLTLKVMASITKMRSGKTLATSSTLLKYRTGSRTSRACSRSLNFPAQEEMQAARVGPLAGSLARDLGVPTYCSPHLSQPLWHSGGQKGRFVAAWDNWLRPQGEVSIDL